MPLAPLRAAHGLRPMSGRDPQEQGRVATPLELLFDLTFVVARQCRQPDGAHGRRGGCYQRGESHRAPGQTAW